MTDITDVNAVTPDFIDQLNQNFSAMDAALDALVDEVRDVAHGGTGVTGFGLVAAKTGNDTLTADQSYQTFTNEGASGSVTLELPPAAPNLQFFFMVVVAQSLVIDVGGSVVIYVGEISSSAGGSAFSNSPGSIITLKAVSTTVWGATSLVGSWTPA
jgi:hypothetical protein